MTTEAAEPTPETTAPSAAAASIEQVAAAAPIDLNFYWLVVLLGTFCSYVVYYPGLADPESDWLRDQAMNVQFNDWHAIGMTLIWALVAKLQMATGGLLLAHVAIFWLGIAAFACALPRSRRWLPVAAGLSPLLFPMLGHITKDITIVACMTFAFGMYALASSRPAGEGRKRRAFLALALFGVFWATLSRYNALPATLPLLWLIATALAPTQRRLQYKLVAGLTGFVVIGVALTNFFLVSQHRYPAQQTMVYDIIGTSVRCHENLLPELYQTDLPTPLTLSELEQIYQPFDNITTLWGKVTLRRPKFISSAPDQRALTAAWLNTAFTHPVCYLAHRLELMWFATGYHTTQYTTYPDPESGLFRREPPANFTLRNAYYQAFAVYFGSYWARPGTSLMVLAVCIWFFIRRRQPLPLSIAASGLIYFLTMFLLGVALHFRYSYWVVTAATIAVIYGLAEARAPAVASAHKP